MAVFRHGSYFLFLGVGRCVFLGYGCGLGRGVRLGLCRPIEFELAFEKPPIPEATHHLDGVWMAGTTRNSPRPARAAASLAEAARARISEYAEAEVFSSDLQRALQTARVVGDLLRHDEGLPDAETKASFAQRSYAVLEAILESSCDHQIIVSHAATSTSGSPPEVSRNSARTTTATTARSSTSVTLAISPLDPGRWLRSGAFLSGNLDGPRLACEEKSRTRVHQLDSSSTG